MVPSIAQAVLLWTQRLARSLMETSQPTLSVYAYLDSVQVADHLQHQCIKNLTAVLEAAGTDIDNVVKVNVFLADMKDFAAMNEVYAQYWGETKPCRT